MPVIRDANGKVLPGSSLNPRGANQYTSQAERLGERARALLDRETGSVELEALGLSPAARCLLPTEGATLTDALLAALVTGALAGDPQARRDLLARVWPTLRPAEPIRVEVDHAPQHEHYLEADAGKLAEMLDLLAKFEGEDEEDDAGDAQDGGFAAAGGGAEPI